MQISGISNQMNRVQSTKAQYTPSFSGAAKKAVKQTGKVAAKQVKKSGFFKRSGQFIKKTAGKVWNFIKQLPKKTWNGIKWLGRQFKDFGKWIGRGFKRSPEGKAAARIKKIRKQTLKERAKNPPKENISLERKAKSKKLRNSGGKGNPRVKRLKGKKNLALRKQQKAQNNRNLVNQK